MAKQEVAKELKEAAVAGALIGSALDKALADDGRIKLIEFRYFIPILDEIAAGIKDAQEISKEWGKLTKAQLEDILQAVKDALDIEDDVAEDHIEGMAMAGANFAYHLSQLIKHRRAAKKAA